TKTRAEVSGGGKKPWRQKGTGRARQGSIRSPQWRHGGIVFGPVPRSYAVKVNQKVKQLALKSALSHHVLSNQLSVLDSISLDQPKTKLFLEVINNLKLEGKTLILDANLNSNVVLAAANVPNADFREA